MKREILSYNSAQTKSDKAICVLLMKEVDAGLVGSQCKLWHGHPVWFLEGNPIVGYSKLKGSVRLLFWSGQTFGEKKLLDEGSFKAAEVRYTSVEEVYVADIQKWLKKAKKIQWDYKNIVKRKGRLERLM